MNGIKLSAAHIFSVSVWCLNFVSGAHPHTHITFYPSPARFMKATLKQRVLFVGRFSFFACLPFYISNMGCNASTNLFALSSQLFYNYGSTFLDMMQHINLFFQLHVPFCFCFTYAPFCNASHYFPLSRFICEYVERMKSVVHYFERKSI